MPRFGSPDVAKLASRGNEKGLIRALRHEDPKIRASAADALRGTASAAAVDALCAALRDEVSDVRTSAAATLGRLRDPRALAPLVGALHDDSPSVRGVVAVQLGRLGDPRAIEPLAGALRDPSPWVRQDAVRGLALLPSPDAVPAMITALGDEDGRVRKCATDALAARGAAPDAQVWLDLLRRDGIGLDVREEAAATLRFSSDERCRADIRDPLAELLERDAVDGETRRWAAIELAQLDDPRAIEPLLAELRSGRGDDVWARIVALDRLGALDAPRWVSLLGDERVETRAAAIRALARDAGGRADGPAQPEVVEALLGTLRDESPDVRIAGRDALAVLAPSRAVEALVDLLDDPRSPLRREAYDALGALDDPRAVAARRRAAAPRVGDRVRVRFTELVEVGMPGDRAYVTSSSGGWTGTVVSIAPETGTATVRRDAVHGGCELPVGEVAELAITMLASTDVAWPDGDEPRWYEVDQ